MARVWDAQGFHGNCRQQPHSLLIYCRFEPDMLAFSGCYFGGGEKERNELGEIRKRWTTLPVRLQPIVF
jgi:hypothetical protein